ncbi:Multidrug efflux pump Tap OS=Streptomyces rimosus subsp. rimosus (strain ATCC / DSM 40260 /JCM 4667 / NRRL 2234) OX=1265868 GN=SRIM_003585 PE=3 SV=1 [Streptomyces rimosus subsp. rimosus]
MAGPGLGGGIVQLLGPPVAVLANAAGYLASALFLRGIRVLEPEPEAAAGGSLGAQVKEGLAFAPRHPVLRVIALTTGVANFFSGDAVAVQTVFLRRGSWDCRPACSA